MAAKSKSIVPANGGSEVTLALPAYAARYLKSMCQRERAVLNNIGAAGGSYNPALDAALDALTQIESAIS